MHVVLRIFTFALILAAGAAKMRAATLEQLSLDDMILQSTGVVRGQVVGSSPKVHGSVIYTHYTIQVAESYKGTYAGWIEVMVPGGTLNGVVQTVDGAPRLAAGSQYVLFLWTSRTGVTSILGLTQGLFALPGDASADPTAVRDATKEMMFDRKTSLQVRDARLAMRLSDLKARIAATLAAGKGN